jgi:hypothetical protein
MEGVHLKIWSSFNNFKFGISSLIITFSMLSARTCMLPTLSFFYRQIIYLGTFEFIDMFIVQVICYFIAYKQVFLVSSSEIVYINIFAKSSIPIGHLGPVWTKLLRHDPHYTLTKCVATSYAAGF